jgi:hypothetical protein
MNLNNIHYYEDNFISQIGKLRQHILFLDPPWGGIKYRMRPQVGLSSPGGVFYSISHILDILPSFGIYSPEVICIKLPKSYTTQCIKKNNYPYKSVYSLKTKQGIILYKLLILSKRLPTRTQGKLSFTPIGYKKIKYTRI